MLITSGAQAGMPTMRPSRRGPNTGMLAQVSCVTYTTGGQRQMVEASRVAGLCGPPSAMLRRPVAEFLVGTSGQSQLPASVRSLCGTLVDGAGVPTGLAGSTCGPLVDNAGVPTGPVGSTKLLMILLLTSINLRASPK